MKIHVITGSQVCAYTRTLQEFLCFCCHKRYNALHKTLYISFIIHFSINYQYYIPQTGKTTSENANFRVDFFPKLFSIFLPFLTPPFFTASMTLLTAKQTTLQLECARLRVRTRKAHRIYPSIVFLIFPSSFAFPFFSFGGSCFCTHNISVLIFAHCIFGVTQRKKMHFSAIYHALGLYLPIYK